MMESNTESSRAELILARTLPNASLTTDTCSLPPSRIISNHTQREFAGTWSGHGVEAVKPRKNTPETLATVAFGTSLHRRSAAIRKRSLPFRHSESHTAEIPTWFNSSRRRVLQ